MTFFYDLNKKLADISAKPETKQINERDEGKHNNAVTGFKALADKAAKEYGSKAAGKRVAGAVRAKMAKAGKLEEADMEESAFQAAIGKKKYGEEGMKALQKAGREHASAKTMSNIRNKYDKYDESMEEGMLDSLKNVGKKIAGGINRAVGHGSDEQMRADLQKKMGLPPTGKKPQTIAFHKSNTVDDNAVVGKVKEEYGPLESAGGKPMTAKQKAFAKLAPPEDKITFADKIAGAKKEVDEMLGDVAANAMRKAVKGKKVADEGSDWSQLGKEYSKPKVGSVTHGAKHDIEHTATGQRVTRRVDPNTGHSVGAEDDKPMDGEKRGRGRPKKADRAPERVTSKAYKHKGGRKVAEDGSHGQAQQIYDELADIRAVAKQAQRDGQFPQGYASRVESVLWAAMTLIKNQQPANAQVSEEELDEKAVSKAQQRFMGMVHATQKGEKAPSKEVAKVAKSMKKKDAEDFAATKHKGLPEKKKPEGKKKEKTEEAGGSGTPTASSGFSFGKGIYDSMNRELENMIAESMSINMSDSTEGGKSFTITATDDDAMKLAEIIRNAGIGGAAPEAGEVEVVGIDSPISGDEGHDHSEPCETCGSADCGCGDVEEALAENEPDWPTDEVVSDDALQYSGGLNGPKSTGQTTVPVIANQGDRTGIDDEALRRLREAAGIAEQEQVMAPESVEEAKEMCDVCEATPCKCDESVEESIARFRSLAGIQETKKVEEDDMEEGNLFTGNLAKARAAGAKEADLDGDGDMEKVRESVNKMTNLWKAYKG